MSGDKQWARLSKPGPGTGALSIWIIRGVLDLKLAAKVDAARAVVWSAETWYCAGSGSLSRMDGGSVSLPCRDVLDLNGTGCASVRMNALR